MLKHNWLSTHLLQNLSTNYIHLQVFLTSFDYNLIFINYFFQQHQEGVKDPDFEDSLPSLIWLPNLEPLTKAFLYNVEVSFL